jgi:hypothetical protein
MDPEKLGRCRVRIFGYHTDNKEVLPTEDLPWALPIQPITSAGISGIGSTPLGPVTGTWVLGFFLDGEDMQQPAMLGTIATNTPPKSFLSPDEKESVQNKNDGLLKDSQGNVVTDSQGEPIRSGVPQVEGWELGQTSEQYESGGKGPGTINDYNGAAKGDFGGASYGTYQFASYLPTAMPNGKARPNAKVSPVVQYLRYSKFKDQFTDLVPGTSAFDNKWKEIAGKNTQAFKNDQHTYIKEKYYDVMVANLERKGLLVSKFGPAVQDLIWSTAVQLGPNATSVFTVPLKDKAELTDKEIVEVVSEYKIASVDTLFKSSSDSIKAGVRTRYRSEKQKLLSLIKA